MGAADHCIPGRGATVSGSGLHARFLFWGDRLNARGPEAGKREGSHTASQHQVRPPRATRSMRAAIHQSLRKVKSR
jgi:hypothetical protein